MKFRFGPLALLASLALVAACPAAHAAPAARTLQVFAAASLSDAFGELGRQLEGARPGLAVQFNFAGSQQLAAQVEQGATPALFASADERSMDRLASAGLLDGAPVVFATNRIVAIVPRTNPGRVRDLCGLARDGLKVVLAADAVPAGRYARTVLRALSTPGACGADYAARVLGNVVSEEENVKAVVGKVQLGEADAGFVYVSDVTPAVARFVTVLGVPDSANVTARYPIAFLRGAGENADARAFVDLVRSDAGRRVLQRHGLRPALGAFGR